MFVLLDFMSVSLSGKHHTETYFITDRVVCPFNYVAHEFCIRGQVVFSWLERIIRACKAKEDSLTTKAERCDLAKYPQY